MSNLREQVPLGSVRGSVVMVSPEWFRELTLAIDSISDINGLTPEQLAMLEKLPTYITAAAALSASVTALTARVAAAEAAIQDGYQS